MIQVSLFSLLDVSCFFILTLYPFRLIVAADNSWERFRTAVETVDVTNEKALALFMMRTREELRAPLGATERILVPAAKLNLSGALVRLSRNDSSSAGSGSSVEVAPIIPSPFAPPLRSPFTTGLTLCTRLATVARALEERLLYFSVDLQGTGREAEINRISALIVEIRSMILERIDSLTQMLLIANQEYALDIKDGRELFVFDAFKVQSSAEELRRVGQEMPERHRLLTEVARSADEVAAEIVLWANIPPGKITRAKQVVSTAAPLPPGAPRGSLTFSAELHKTMAAANAALRLIWTPTYDAAAAEGIAKDRLQQRIQEAEATFADRDALEARKATIAAASVSRVNTKPSATKTSESSEEKKSEDPEASQAVAAENLEDEKKAPEDNEEKAAEDEKKVEEGADEASAAAVTNDSEGKVEGGETQEETREPYSLRAIDDAARSAEEDAKREAAEAASLGPPKLSVLGGVLHIDFLALPPPPASTKGMVLVREDVVKKTSAATVKRLPHPLIAQGVTAAMSQAIKVKLIIPDKVIVPTDPVVARYDAALAASGASGWTRTRRLSLHLFG